jgi:NAD-dependent SIR2 family protein deacetylase
VSPGSGSVPAEAKPNPAHFALAKLEQKLQDRLFLCTPNVDDLHEQGGSKRVVYMHGELFTSRCDTCNRPQFHDTKTYDPPAKLPRCRCFDEREGVNQAEDDQQDGSSRKHAATTLLLWSSRRFGQWQASFGVRESCNTEQL